MRHIFKMISVFAGITIIVVILTSLWGARRQEENEMILGNK